MGFQLLFAQLVKAGFLSHQQIDIFFLKCDWFFSSCPGLSPAKWTSWSSQGLWSLGYLREIGGKEEGHGIFPSNLGSTSTKKGFSGCRKKKNKTFVQGNSRGHGFFLEPVYSRCIFFWNAKIAKYHVVFNPVQLYPAHIISSDYLLSSKGRWKCEICLPTFG